MSGRQKSKRYKRLARRSACRRPSRAPAVEPLERRLLLSAGDLDPGFGFWGYRATDLGWEGAGVLLADDFSEAVAVQPDGKTIVAGSVELDSFDGQPTWDGSTRADIVLARYNPDGSLDRGFGPYGTGVVLTDLGGVDHATDIAIQPDGRIVVVGLAQSLAGDFDFAIVRYTAGGLLDGSFGSDGGTLIDFAGGNDWAYGVALQSDGKIVVVGPAVTPGSGRDFGVVRLQPDGQLDETFSGDGKQTVDFLRGTNDIAFSAAIQPDGKIVVAGKTEVESCGQFFCPADDGALVRLSSTGALDTTFGGIPGFRFGLRTFDADDRPDAATDKADVWKAVKVQPDGKIVVAGYSSSGTDRDVAVARYDVFGDLDSSFGTNGWLRTDFTAGHDSAEAVAIQSDGKLVVAGQAAVSSSTDFAVLRYLSDGSLDTSFGFKGTWLAGATALDFGYDDFAYDLALADNGSIVVAGYTQSLWGADVLVARYTNDLGDQWDLAGSGDTRASAVDLGQIAGVRHLSDLSIHEADDEDWFRFNIGERGVDGHQVRISYESDLGELALELYGPSGMLLGVSEPSRDEARVSLSGLPALGSGQYYYIRVAGSRGATNPRYDLELSAYEPPAPDQYDAAGSNDTRSAAADLGRIEGRRRIEGLSIHSTSDIDWFRFELADRAGTRHYVRVDAEQLAGDLSLVLIGAGGVVHRWEAGAGEHEQLSLAGLPAGTYY